MMLKFVSYRFISDKPLSCYMMNNIEDNKNSNDDKNWNKTSSVFLDKFSKYLTGI